MLQRNSFQMISLGEKVEDAKLSKKKLHRTGFHELEGHL